MGLHRTQGLRAPVYGMNRGTVGFLMNEYSEHGLAERLEAAEEAVINPLAMTATRADGSVHEALAINEVSLLRAGPQAARLRISVDGKLRMAELVCDGALVAFRPRRWRGALLPKTAQVTFEVLDPEKRPVMAEADSRSVRDVVRVEIRSAPEIAHRVLFDPGHGLEERLIREQFV